MDDLTGSGHHLQLEDMVSLSAQLPGAGAHSTHGQRAADRRVETVGEQWKCAPDAERGVRHFPPPGAGLHQHGVTVEITHGVESAQVDEQTILDLRLAVRAVRRTADRQRQSVLDAVPHGRTHVGHTARTDHPQGDAMPVAAVVLGCGTADILVDNDL